MAATQGHTQSLHTNALDEALALPTDFSARIARNTQLFLQQESGTCRVIDPWGGSAYVEKLTHDLAQRAWQHIEEVEAAGGMAKAIDAGIPKLRVEEAAARTQARIDSGRQALIGVNKYRVETDEEIDVLKVDNSSVRTQQIEKLRRLREERDESACQDGAAGAGRRGEVRSGRGAGGQSARAGGGRGPRDGDGRRDLGRPGIGVRAPLRPDPYDLRCVPRRSRPLLRCGAHPGTGGRVRARRGAPAAHPGGQDGPGRP